MPTLLVLAALPPLIESLLTELLRGAGDVRVETRLDRLDGQPLGLLDPHPDVLLVGPEVTDRQIHGALFQLPRVRALRLENAGDVITVHELHPQRTTARHVGPQRLLELIRSTVGRDETSA